MAVKTVWTMRIAGATPKLMVSQRLSSWAPKSVAFRVILATRPSRASKTMAAKISQAESVRLPSLALPSGPLVA